MLFDPFASSPLVSGSLSHSIPARIFMSGLTSRNRVHLIEVYAGVVAIMIGKGEIANPFRAREVDPGLKELERVRLDAMALGVSVVIGGERVDGDR